MTDTGALDLATELKQRRPFRSPAQEASISLLRTADAVRRSLTAVVERAGITFQQYNVLRILRGAHPTALATLEIRERLIERTPGITRLVDRLDGMGLIRRIRCGEDRRRIDCSITEQGLALLASLDDAVDRADEQAVAPLATDELERLVDVLARVRGGLG